MELFTESRATNYISLNAPPLGRLGLARARTAVTGLAVFVGSFELFLLEPLVAKQILPWFGGGAAVWTTCFLFFQLLLCAAYIYAHLLLRYRTRWSQPAHVLLLLASLATLPPALHTAWKPEAAANPWTGILSLLCVMAGPSFFLLASGGPILQAWFAGSGAKRSPWPLFALSNIGSIGGLLAYPFLLEPNWTLREQAGLWSGGYLLWVVLMATAAALRCFDDVGTSRTLETDSPAVEPAARKGGFRQFAEWCGLGAWPSALVLATTNHLTQNVAPVPLLWVAPLSLYLLSFAVCFAPTFRERKSGTTTRLSTGSALVAAGIGGILLLGGEPTPGLWGGVLAWCLVAFLLFCVCHGQLAARRPGSDGLSGYYLAISVGGALGGIAIAVAAPLLLHSMLDLPLTLGGTMVFLAVLKIRPRAVLKRKPRAVLGLAPLACALAYAVLLGVHDPAGRRFGAGEASDVVRERDFFGAITVTDMDSPKGPVRVMQHGTIAHGAQAQAPLDTRMPTAYYGHDSGVGRALETLGAKGPMRVGVIGLGAGVLASYGRTGDTYRFYEIDPMVTRLANTVFSFLLQSPAAISVVAGDARLSLEKEPPQHFDLLSVDAFSGDSIPVHLLTVEAFRVYARHLRPGGVLAIHVSNKYLTLAPVVVGVALETLGEARFVEDAGKSGPFDLPSKWVLITDQSSFFDDPRLQTVAAFTAPTPKSQVWTDDFSGIALAMPRRSF